MSEELLKRIVKVEEEQLKVEEEQLKVEEEQLKWTRMLGMNQLKSIFEQNLRSDDEKLVYELSDGERSTRDIERIAGVGRSKIAILWKKWYNIGIMVKSTKYEGRRMKRSFSLSDVGFEVPPLPTANNSQATETEFE